MNFEAEFRNIKINLINGLDFDLPITDEVKNKFRNELRFIKDTCPNDTITGSLALNLYGVIDRKVKDIDIIIKDKDRYSSYTKHIDHYSSMSEREENNNNLGYIFFDYKTKRQIISKIENFLTSNNRIIDFILETFIRNTVFTILNFLSETISYAVDFFVEIDNKFETFEFEGHTYKIQYIMNLIDVKSKLITSDNSWSATSSKHKIDLEKIFTNLKYKDTSPYHIVDMESMFSVSERRERLIDRLLDEEERGFRRPLFRDLFKDIFEKASN